MSLEPIIEDGGLDVIMNWYKWTMSKLRLRPVICTSDLGLNLCWDAITPYITHNLILTEPWSDNTGEMSTQQYRSEIFETYSQGDMASK